MLQEACIATFLHPTIKSAARGSQLLVFRLRKCPQFLRLSATLRRYRFSNKGRNLSC